MDAYIARQPIFDRKLRVEGYELLFRSGFEGVCAQDDPEVITSRVISNVLHLGGFEDLTAGKRIFVNIPREFLLEGHYRILPRELAVLEILESVPCDAEVLGAVERARREGYRIALDDFIPGQGWERAFPLVDIVKVDVLDTTPANWARIAESCRPHSIELLAEKVEDRETHTRVRELGYSYFQGFFFARPETRIARDIPATQITFLQLLNEVHKPHLDMMTIEALIQRELAVSYKLFRFLRSAYFGWRRNVVSVHHALLIMGEREFRSWASVMAVAGMAQGKPGELVTQANVLGRFCELLAGPTGLEDRASSAFFVGLFSLLEVILDRPLAAVLDEIALEEEVRGALLGEPGPLRDVLEVAVAYSSGDWTAVERVVDRMGIDPDVVPVLFAAALCESGGSVEERGDESEVA